MRGACALAVLAAVALGGCSDPVDPGSVHFVTHLEPASEQEIAGIPPLEVAHVGGTVEIRGRVEVPGTCGAEEVRGELAGGRITVTFALDGAREDDPPSIGPVICITSPRYWKITATPVGLPPGSYGVRLQADLAPYEEGLRTIATGSFEL